MWQMFRWLSQWLNSVLQYLPHSLPLKDIKTGREENLVDSLPELTNADLEFLFTELLEGVQQARGQQWAINYLQRMQPRITEERWLDWLLMFGERLLASPAPNHHLAGKMIKLGELGVGRVGDLAFDIGIRLLRRDFVQDTANSRVVVAVPPATTVATTPVIDESLDSPGQQLIRELGEQLWEYDGPDVPNVASVPSPVAEEYQFTTNFHTPAPAESDNNEVFIYEYAVDPEAGVVFEYTEPARTATTEPVEDDSLYSPSTDLHSSKANLEPDTIAQTLDNLASRLEENTNLVQQIASELALTRQGMIEPAKAQITLMNQAQVFFYEGLKQAKIGDLEGALACYGQATRLQPDAYEYWFNQGLILFHLHRFDEALAAYDRTLELKPDFYTAWYNRGGILGEMGDFEGAIASFDQAINVKPDDSGAWSSKGLALLRLGLIWEAVASYDQALKLQPEDQEIWYYRGVALAVGEQYEDAIASYDQALEIQPDYDEVWIDRGVVLFNLKRWSQAIESWDKALANQPELYLAWFNRGVALDNLGNQAEAIASYQKAIAIKSDFHLAWYNQAVALFHLERFTEAIACYDSALSIKLDYWEAWIGRGTAAGHLGHEYNSLSLTSAIATTNPALNVGGYEGKIASYQEGLKHLRPDTHPEGWGRLHIVIGNTDYEQGKKEDLPRLYWQNAVLAYQQALFTLTPTDFPELHLEVLQSLTKVLISLGEISVAQASQIQAVEVLQELLAQSLRSDESKKQLALRFVGLEQLAVDLAVDAGDFVEAWEIAEQGKNDCLQWLLFGWSEDVHSTKYKSVQKLLNPSTAIVYWHLSPAALHTFIIKDQAPSPILVFTPIQDVQAIPEGVQRLIEFENWLADWQRMYYDYCQNHQNAENQHHPWRGEMEQKLLHLRGILNISTIVQELEGINNLILVPHRDLAKLPLQSLFSLSSTSTSNSYTISYLPSTHLGITSKIDILSDWQNQKLLSVEQSSPVDESELQPLQFSVEMIGNLFPNKYRLLGHQINKNHLDSWIANGYNILHLGSHAQNNLSQPDQSQIILSNEERLNLTEIVQQSLFNLNLVTLADCATVYQSNQHINTEYLGLETSFINAGVPYVLTTIWDVESTAQALVMVEFYRQLQLQQSPAIALGTVTNWLKEITNKELTQWYDNLLNSLPGEEFKVRNYLATQMYQTSKLPADQKLYHHPYYWAGFILLGKP
jgi:CHAT domain-containing protein/Flp pilus assembly protein TadD